MIEDPKQYLLEQLIDAVMAGEVRQVHTLLDLGVNPNGYLDHAQMTPLHFAASHNQVQAARLLLFAGADPYARTYPEGETPKDNADTLGHQAFSDLLAQWQTHPDPQGGRS